MTEKKGKCARSRCECRVAEGCMFCSRYCESMFNQPACACMCGHAECADSETVEAAA